MSLPVDAIVQRLVEAERWLLQWGLQEKAEVDLVNRAYRAVEEALALLRSGRPRLPPRQRVAVEEKLKLAHEQLERALKELGKGKTNPSVFEVVTAVNAIHGALRTVWELMRWLGLV